jgi:hypothetical protein
VPPAPNSKLPTANYFLSSNIRVTLVPCFEAAKRTSAMLAAAHSSAPGESGGWKSTSLTAPESRIFRLSAVCTVI